MILDDLVEQALITCYFQTCRCVSMIPNMGFQWSHSHLPHTSHHRHHHFDLIFEVFGIESHIHWVKFSCWPKYLALHHWSQTTHRSSIRCRSAGMSSYISAPKCYSSTCFGGESGCGAPIWSKKERMLRWQLISLAIMWCPAVAVPLCNWVYFVKGKPINLPFNARLMVSIKLVSMLHLIPKWIPNKFLLKDANTFQNMSNICHILAYIRH